MGVHANSTKGAQKKHFRDVEALEIVLRLTVKLVEALSHVPSEAALRRFCLFCADPFSMFKITSALLEITRELTFAPPPRL